MRRGAAVTEKGEKGPVQAGLLVCRPKEILTSGTPRAVISESQELVVWYSICALMIAVMRGTMVIPPEGHHSFLAARRLLGRVTKSC